MLNVISGFRTLAFASVFGVAVSAMANPLKGEAPASKSKHSIRQQMLNREAKFYENKGQWDNRGQFLTRQPSLDIWFEDRGVDFDYYKVQGPLHNRTREGQSVSMQFAGKGAALKFEGVKQTSSHTDYLIGKKTVLGVRGFDELRSKNVFPGIDFRGYYADSAPRYDFVVSPGASPSNIDLKFKGANSVSLKHDSIVFGTTVGERMQGDLHAYQMIRGNKKPVAAHFVLKGKSEVRIAVGAYDSKQPLIIDPLIYGTYFGGDSGFDEVRDVVADPAIDAGTYLTGDTQSIFFPAIFGPYGFNLKGTQNAFLAKLQGDAYNIDYAAYIGGSQVDTGQFLRLDPAGNLWMVGTSTSPDFPGNSLSNKSVLFGQSGATGTFQIQYVSSSVNQTTASLPANATPAQVQNAINALPAINNAATVTDLDGTNTLNNGSAIRGGPAELGFGSVLCTERHRLLFFHSKPVRLCFAVSSRPEHGAFTVADAGIRLRNPGRNRAEWFRCKAAGKSRSGSSRGHGFCGNHNETDSQYTWSCLSRVRR